MSDDKQKQPGIAPSVDDNIDDLGRDVNDKSSVPGDKATVDKTHEGRKAAETASHHNANAIDPELHKDADAPNSQIDDL